MASFSEEQKQIGLFLLEGPVDKEKVIEKFVKSREFVEKELENLQKAGFLEEKEGKLSLRPDIAQELERRRGIQEHDRNQVRLHAMIEVKSLEKDLLTKSMDKIEEQLKKVEEFQIYDIQRAKIQKEEGEEGYYSSFLEVNLSLKDFSALVFFMFFFGPVSIEVIKPSSITLDAGDLQEGLMDFAEMNQKYVHFITKLMNRQELEAFHRSLLE